MAKFVIKNVRLAFNALTKASQYNGTGDFMYSGTLLIRKDDKENLDRVRAAIEEEAKAKWGAEYKDRLKALSSKNHLCLQDGDAKFNAKGEILDGFEGCMFVSVRGKSAPGLYDADKSDLPEGTSRIYSGCYVNASINTWVQDNSYGRRVNASALGIQFAGNGDSFAAGAKSDGSEFDVVSVGDLVEDFGF